MASIPHVRLIDNISGNEAVITAGGDVNTTPTGRAADGAAVAGNPVWVAGTDGANARGLLTDTSGRQRIVGAGADGAATVGDPVLIGGTDGVNTQTISTDNTGAVNVNIVSTGAAGTKTLDPTTIAGQTIAANANADFDTADIASANESGLIQVTISGTQPWSADIFTVEDGTATQVTAPITGEAGKTVIWDIDPAAITLNGGNAGLDAFRVNITNEDNNKDGDYFVNICYRTA